MNSDKIRTNVFSIFLMAAVFIQPLSGEGAAVSLLSSAKEKTMLVIPARPGVVQLAFDLARMRAISIVSFQGKVNVDKPLLHVWTGSAWQYVSFDDFCSLRFIGKAPKTVILIGDDQTVPKTLLQGMSWAGRIERLATMNPAGLINGLDPYFKFNSREWKQLFSDNERADAVQPKPDNKLHLALTEDESILFVWIAPLSIWVGQYEVTNVQYGRFNRAHDPKRYYDHILNLPDQPAVLVSWEDANNYCGWLNRNFRGQLPPGFEFRLPTEKEWTAFAACGRKVQYPWGDQWPPPDALNYKGTEGAGLFYDLVHNEKFIRDHDDGFIVAAPVDKSGPNAWGLYGVGGNVWEWCQDWFDATKTTRVLRGAAWNNYEPAILAVSNRSDALPEKSNAMIGFRVVIAPRKK